MALQLLNGPLKPRSELEPVPRCEPSTVPTSPLADGIASGPVQIHKTQTNI